MPSQRIAVIGAGCAGIASLRALLSRPSAFDVTVFEKKNAVGGVWRHDGQGPMYRDLRTNLPKPVMSFTDKSFEGTTSRSYPTHEEVLQYIEDYLDETNARHLIKHNCEVLNVQPTSDRRDGTRWVVRFHDPDGDHVDFFHAVFVCNGHHEVGVVPRVPGIESFGGQVLHSKEFDTPEPFAGKKVIVVGARSSGLDIAIGIAPFAKEVLVCHRQASFPHDLPPNARPMPTIESFKDGAFCLTDGTCVSGVDALIFCTGYAYSFPFLDPTCGVTVRDGCVRPLWLHLVNARYPSMFFLGLLQIVSPLPQLNLQAALAVALLEGRVTTPSTKAMLQEIEAEFKKKILETGDKPSHFHVFASAQWDYNDRLADLCGTPRLPRYVKNMYNDAGEKRIYELLDYRSYNYRVTSSDGFEVEKIEP